MLGPGNRSCETAGHGRYRTRRRLTANSCGKTAPLSRGGHCRFLAFQKKIDLFANGAQIVETQIDDGVANVGDEVQLFQACDHHVPCHARRHFSFPQGLELGLDLPNQALDVCRGYWSLCTSNPNSSSEFLPVEVLPRSVLLDDQRPGKNRTFVATESLPTLEAFAAASDATMTVMGGVKDLGIVMLAVGAAH